MCLAEFTSDVSFIIGRDGVIVCEFMLKPKNFICCVGDGTHLSVLTMNPRDFNRKTAVLWPESEILPLGAFCPSTGRV